MYGRSNVMALDVSKFKNRYFYINFNEIKESEEKEMRKEQLKAGMNVLLRDGTECLVVETTSGLVLFVEEVDFDVDINYYNDELKHQFRSDLDIMKVYSLPKYASCYGYFDGYGRDVIYDRAKTEIKEVTMQEIADQFGIAVETFLHSGYRPDPTDRPNGRRRRKTV